MVIVVVWICRNRIRPISSAKFRISLIGTVILVGTIVALVTRRISLMVIVNIVFFQLEWFCTDRKAHV